MRPGLRLTIVTLTVGGGFTGIAVTLQGFLRGSHSVDDSSLLFLAFACLYAYVVVSGLLLVSDAGRMVPAIIALALQVPWVSSPLFAFRFSAGFHATVGILGRSPQFGFNLGSDWICSLAQNAPSGGGVNLFALAMLVLTLRARTSMPQVPKSSNQKEVSHNY